MAHPQQTSTKPTMQNKNVASGQLAFFSPSRGFYKDGYCRTGPDDTENTSVAALVNEDFLNFSNSQGSGLGKQGVVAGNKTCLATRHWKQAFDAAQRGELSQSAVPRVFLHASHENALQDLSYGDLKKYEMREQSAHENPEIAGGVAQESKHTGGYQGTTAPAPGNVNKKTDPHNTSGQRG